MKEKIKVGLLGLGTVGTGVVELLRQNQELIQQKTGTSILVTKAVVSNLSKDRGIDLSDIELSTDPNFVLNDSNIDIVVELMGGTTTALEAIIQALKNKKPTVTANKAVIAEYTQQIYEAALENQTYLAYEAAVGGGIPIIRTICEGFKGEEIKEISGIMNGTGNYILTTMLAKNLDFKTVLKDAQDLGYAEADPSYDVDGIDTAHKLIILMNLAHHRLFSLNDLEIKGIRNIDVNDLNIAKEFGGAIKLLGNCKKNKNQFTAKVQPYFVSGNNPLSHVPDAFNSISITGNFVGNTNLYGQGAGSHPTASAVVGDIIQAVEQSEQNIVAILPQEKASISNSKTEKSSFLVRVDFEKGAMSLDEFSQFFGSKNIEIQYSSMKKDQKEFDSFSMISKEIEESKLESIVKELKEKNSIQNVKSLPVLT